MSTEPEIRQVTAFLVNGFTVRTSNLEEIAGAGRIASLWMKFMADSHLCGDGPPVAVYDSYEGDHLAPYDLTVGCVGKEAAAPPDGVTTDVVAADYLVYGVGDGEMPQALIETWQRIWGDFERDDFPWKRTFVCDFEQHGEKTEVFIGVTARE